MSKKYRNINYIRRVKTNCAKKKVLIAFLNVFNDSIFLTEQGRSFHSLGAAARKERSPSVTSVYPCKEQVVKRHWNENYIFWCLLRKSVHFLEKGKLNIRSPVDIILTLDSIDALKLVLSTHHDWKKQRLRKITMLQYEKAWTLIIAE